MATEVQDPPAQAESNVKEGSGEDQPNGTSKSGEQHDAAGDHEEPERAQKNETDSHEESGSKDNAAEDGDAQQPNSDKQDGHRPNAAERAKSEMAEIKDKLTDKKQRIRDKTKPPGGFDKTPLPDVPPGYTIKITFHCVKNLPAADLKNASSDPYVHATITTSLPKRHEDDPPLVHRTHTIHETTEPEWEEEWVVANIPASGFTLKCRLYDEDSTDHDDPLGDVTVRVPHLDENWRGIGSDKSGKGKDFDVRKRTGSKRAYFFRAVHSGIRKGVSMTPHLYLSIEMVGRSDPPGGKAYTVGPTRWIRHFSPMIGRLAGIKVNTDEEKDAEANEQPTGSKTKKFDFQANEIQLAGPVPPKLYHRFVEFRPVIGMMFTKHGVRGWILNKALHKQHSRIYHYTPKTEYGSFEPCSEQASLQLLKMAHFDEGGRIFTYVLTLDGLLRFTETGKEFGIDMLSKHTMHSDVATYIACSGEFFIRRLKHSAPKAERDDPDPDMPTHPDDEIPGGPPESPPPTDPSQYQLIIDNDSGTYRPDKSIIPDLKQFLERNFPGLGIVVMHCADKELDKLKEAQMRVKKREGRKVNMVLNRSPSASSFGSSDESRLGEMEERDDAAAAASGDGGKEKEAKTQKRKSVGAAARDRLKGKSKKEAAYDVLENPKRVREYMGKSPEVEVA